jgi:phosphohistidine phosphatase
MRRNARGLRRLVGKLDELASSPLSRALQTAEIVADAFGELEIETLPALAPGGAPRDVATWIASQGSQDGMLAVVGHEPDLGELVCWFLAGRGSFVPLRKGGACLLELASASPGSAKLLWSLTSRQLRRLA